MITFIIVLAVLMQVTGTPTNWSAPPLSMHAMLRKVALCSCPPFEITQLRFQWRAMLMLLCNCYICVNNKTLRVMLRLTDTMQQLVCSETH